MKKNVIAALVVTMALGVGATAYAASTDSTAPSKQGQRLGLGRITSMRAFGRGMMGNGQGRGCTLIPNSNVK
jgi:hypothetical protein